MAPRMPAEGVWRLITFNSFSRTLLAKVALVASVVRRPVLTDVSMRASAAVEIIS